REDETDEVQGSTTAAAELARQRITEIIGAEKVQQLSDLALERWGNGQSDVAQYRLPEASERSRSPETSEQYRLPEASRSPLPLASPSYPSPSELPASIASPPVKPSHKLTIEPSAIAYNVPVDTRVVVNAPAHQMDVFENGQLVKSYKIGI